MIDDYMSIIAVIIGTCVLLLMIPFLFHAMTFDFPTERWCQEFNESEYPVVNSSYKMHMEWCIKNETGWHLNISKPMILENSVPGVIAS